MVLCHIVAHLLLWPMIVNIDNIGGNEKTIVAKDNVKATHTQD